MAPSSRFVPAVPGSQANAYVVDAVNSSRQRHKTAILKPASASLATDSFRMLRLGPTMVGATLSINPINVLG